MSTKTAATKPYEIPAEITEQHVAILGKTGSGKTFTAKGYVERLLKDGRRVCIFDPTGVWWGLRYTPKLKPGLRVPIIGGQHGDINDAAPDAVALLAANHSVIIDVSEQLIGDRHKFAEKFFRALYQYNRTPLHLIIDEADEVAPQNPMPESRVMLHQVDRIVRRGRTRGFIVTMISQRPAVLHKNVLSQANTMIAMQLTSSQDRKAIELWIKGQADVEAGKKVLASLPRLQQGQGYVWAPQFDVLERVRFPMIATLDSSRAPKYDEVAIEPPEPASYAGEFSELAGISEQAPDPALNRKRARGTSPFLEKLNAPLPDEVEKAKAAALDEGFRRGMKVGFDQGAMALREELLAAVAKPVFALRTAVLDLALQVEAMQKEIPQRMDAATKERLFTAPAPAPDTNRPKRATPARAMNAASNDAAIINTDIPDPTLRVLGALSSRYPAKFTIGEWAALAGMAPRGGSWNKHLRLLKGLNLIADSDGAVQATPAALQLCGSVQVSASTREELIALWQKKLGGNTERMLGALIAAAENGMTRAEVAEVVGMQATGGAFNKQLRNLVRNNLAKNAQGHYFPGPVFSA